MSTYWGYWERVLLRTGAVCGLGLGVGAIAAMAFVSDRGTARFGIVCGLSLVVIGLVLAGIAHNTIDVSTAYRAGYDTGYERGFEAGENRHLLTEYERMMLGAAERAAHKPDD